VSKEVREHASCVGGVLKSVARHGLSTRYSTQESYPCSRDSMTLLCVTDSRPPSAAGARAAHQIVRADRCASAETASIGCAAGWLGMRAGGLAAAALVAEMSEHGAAGAKLRRSTADGAAGPGAQKLPGCHRLLQLPWKCGCEGPKKRRVRACCIVLLNHRLSTAT